MLRTQMTLDEAIGSVLDTLKPHLAHETWQSRRRYLNQMVRCAQSLKLTYPCQELYDAFILDDHHSSERRTLHILCVRLIDEVAQTDARKADGTYFNPPIVPEPSVVDVYFSKVSFTDAGQSIPLPYLMGYTRLELIKLNLSDSTIGQYVHVWQDILNRSTIKEPAYSRELMEHYLDLNQEAFQTSQLQFWKWKINRKAIHVLIEVIETGTLTWGLISKLNQPSSSLDGIVSDYAQELINRFLKPSTIYLHQYTFRKVLTLLHINQQQSLLIITPDNIYTLIELLGQTFSLNSLSTIIPIVRNILHWLFIHEYIPHNFSFLVMSPSKHKDTMTPYLSEADQAKLMTHLLSLCYRDQLIIRLALQLGLRDSDICHLTFESIQWEEEIISLRQIKTNHLIRLPLLVDIGNCLMHYLLEERPQQATIPTSYIILRKQAPYFPIKSVYPIVHDILEALAIKPINGDARGSHLLRYTFAHNLLKNKIPHQIITDMLGHASIESDKQYLSMDEAMLKQCSLDLTQVGWPMWMVGGDHD